MKNNKAILFDSGKVLSGPVTGHWFMAPNFFKHVDKRVFSSIPDFKRRFAFSKAYEYISKQNLISSLEEEYFHFLEYYKIFFKYLPDLHIDNGTIEATAKDLVYNCDKYEFYQDAIDLIPQLSTDYKLAVVSDAWPSLEYVYRKAGFRDYFSSFVISSMLGVTKPNALMYRTALNELGVSPDEAVFIDDSIKNCDGARILGIKTFLLCRDLKSFVYNKLTCKNHKVLRSLQSFNRLLRTDQVILQVEEKQENSSAREI